MASDERLLCMTIDCQLLLIDALADSYQLLGRMPLRQDGVESLSHPAFVGRRAFIRTGADLMCVDLDSPG